MVKAYSRYSESGSVGLIHNDAAGQTVAWSASGKSIFSAVGTSVVEINVKTGSQVATVSCAKKTLDEGMYASALSLRQPSRVSSLSVTEEHLSMGCTDGSVRVVKLPLSGDSGTSFHGHRGSVNAIAISEEAGLIATGGRDTEIVVWDLIAEAGICRLTGHKGEITSLAFLPGNPDFLVSGSKDGLVKIWSVKLQICVQTITESKSEVWSVGFHGKDRMLVGSSDKVIYVYRIESNLIVSADGLTVAEFHGQLDRPEPADGRITTIAVSGNVVFAQTDRRVVEMWRIVTDEAERTKRMKRRVKRSDDAKENTPKASDEYVIASAPESPSVALRYVANSKVKSMSVCPVTLNGIHMVAMGLGDNQIELFKLATAEDSLFAIKESRSIKREGHRSSVTGLSVSSDGNRLISISAESLIAWNAVTLNFQKVVYSPSGEVVDAFFVPGDSDRVIMVTRDSHICVVDINNGGIVGSPIRLWESDVSDEQDGKKKRRKTAGINQVKCVHSFVSAENDKLRILIGEKDRKLTTIEMDSDTMSFKNVSSFDLPDEPVALSISPKTNKYAAIGMLNSNIELIYSDTGKHFMSLYAHKLAVSAVAFSPDEQVVVSGSSDKNIKVWSTKFGNVLKSIRAHDNAITSLMFVPHSHLVFSTARDGVVSLWDIDRFERVLSKINHPSAEVLAIAASPDAGIVFTGGSDCAVRRITRGDDQMFIEEEQEKAMELEVEGEAQRDDLNGTDVTLPTKSSIESVRFVDKVVEMIEIDEEELDETQVWGKKKDLVKFVATELPPADLQQVVVSLPTGHARRLLAVIAEVMEKSMIQGTRFPAGFPVEQCVSAGLYLIQAQAKYLIGEPHSRQVLLKLKELFHSAIRREIENVGIATASIKFL